MPQNIALAAFLVGAVLLLLALSSGGFKIFGAEMSSAGSRGARIIAGIAGAVLIAVGIKLSIPAVPTTHDGGGGDGRTKNAGAQDPSPSTIATRTPTMKVAVLPAGVLLQDQDSVQIVDVVPAPGSYLHRGSIQTFHLKLTYSLQSADAAQLWVSIAEIPASAGGCRSGVGELSDASHVEIQRGVHDVELSVDWSGDTGNATKGRVYGKGYLGFAPSFWESTGGHRGSFIRGFNGYETACLQFGN